MKAESGSVVGGSGKARIRSTLVLVQVSLGFILLVGAGLLLKSLRAMQATDPGFSTRDVLATYVDMVSAGYDRPRIRSFQDDLWSASRRCPASNRPRGRGPCPFSYRSYLSAPIAVDGFVPEGGRAAGRRIQRGRALLSRDDGDSADLGPGVHARPTTRPASRSPWSTRRWRGATGAARTPSGSASR